MHDLHNHTSLVDRLCLPAAIAALAFSGIVLVLAVIAGPGYRMDLVELSSSFALLRWGGWVGLAVGGLSFVGLVITVGWARWREAMLFALAVALSFAVVIPVRGLQSAAQTKPPIHDVTTNLADPPKFEVLQPRGGAPRNVPAQFKEMEVLSPEDRWKIYHKQAYGDLITLPVRLPAAEALEVVEEVARDLGWKIAAVSPEAGRVEATATTPWFGFQDDVVVRVQPTVASASRVDVRSVSRVGVSDLGANAKRIARFLDRLEDAVKSNS